MKKRTKLALLGAGFIAVLGSLVFASSADLSDIISWGVYGVNEFRITRYGGITQTANSSASNSFVATTIAGRLTLSDYENQYTRTSAQIKATTPTVVGQSVFDTTLKQPVYATGTTTSFDWVTATGTHPSGY